MPEDSNVMIKDDHNSWAKPRWPGKLFPKQEKSAKDRARQNSRGKDVSSFLHISMPVKLQPDTLVSPIDTPYPSRLPCLGEKLASNNLVEPSLGPLFHPSLGRPQKLPRKTGLCVTFDPELPEIIGEGGDEASIPTIEISRSRSRKESGTPHKGQYCSAVQSAPVKLPHEPDRNRAIRTPHLILTECGKSRSSSLQKDPISFDTASQKKELHSNDQDAEPTAFYSTPSLGNTFPSRGLNERSRDLNVLIAELETLCNEGEIHKRSFDSSSLPAERYSINFTDFAEAFSTSSLPEHALLDSGNPSDYPICPKPPPQTQVLSKNTPSQEKPDSALGAFSSTSRQSQGAPGQSKGAFEVESATSHPNLENFVGTNEKDTLTDFVTRVQPCFDIFRVESATTGISLPHWARVSSWWFLKGRGSLEDAIRSRPKNSGVNQGGLNAELLQSIRQAYVDLAKAYWIMTEITPSHSRQVQISDGNSTPLVASETRIGKRGSIDVTELKGVQSKLLASMRGLMNSMQRNRMLPPLSFENRNLDFRIWIESPVLPPREASLLVECRLSSLAIGKLYDAESFFQIPLGDTRHYFNLGRMFVLVSFTFLNDAKDIFHVPCFLTILRERTSLQLEAVLVSQDGQINFTIQSDRNSGKTWEDVHWTNHSHTIHISSSLGPRLKVQFLEQDFIRLYESYEYLQKVQARLKCREGEEIAVDLRLKNFLYTESPSSRTFPSDRIENCQLRLFKMNRSLSNGSWNRNAFHGHRLMITTPLEYKRVNSINNEIGKRTPVFFSYLQGDEGATALLLKIKDDSISSSLIMEFRKASERANVHSLLNGTFLEKDEYCSETMVLQSMFVTNPSVALSDRSSLVDIQWQQLRVINKGSKTKSMPTENLRIWIDCGLGTLVDRVNLGRFTLI